MPAKSAPAPHGCMPRNASGPGTLTVTERAGKNPHTYAVASDAVITYEGQVCMLTDVRVGDMVTVTTDTQAGTTVATTIKARQTDQ